MSARIFKTAPLLLLIAVTASGCAIFPHKKKPPAAPQPRMVGRVAFVRETERFALIDVGSLYTPMPGTALKAFDEAGSETAILSVSPERKRPFIAADIVRGEPHRDDLVFE